VSKGGSYTPKLAWNGTIDLSLTRRCSQEEAVRKDVEWLKGQALVREQLKVGIKGFLYDIKTGKLREVVG